MTGLRARHKADRTRRMQEAAARLFREAGYGAARMEDIAAAADVSVGTLYNYFETKGDLLLAIVSMEVEEVLTEGATKALLTVQFSFEKAFSADDFKSLLFYMGYLTIKTSSLEELVLQIPNEVIARLYWGYFESLVEQDTDMTVNSDDIRTAVRAFALQNDPYPLLAQVERTLEALSNRDDVQLDEKHVKAIFVSYLGLSQNWFIKSEFETERKYIDLLLLRRRPYHIPYQFAIEFKYIHKNKAKTFKEVYKAAQAQLDNYLEYPEIAGLDSRKAWLFVFVGTKKEVAEER